MPDWPARGPIAILPQADPVFVDAVESAGGTVAPLSENTRGLIWLDYRDPERLREVLRTHPSVGWVQLPWAGVDSFADVLGEQARANLVWTSAKGAFARPVAEHALTLSLALLRRLPIRLRAASWGGKAGTSLYGLDVVIVGAGGIAAELLRLLEPFGARTTIVRRRDAPVLGADRTVTIERLHDVLPGADLVVVAAALTEGTAGLFGAPEFDRMKRSAYIVNVARGGLVDTHALVAALDAGTIAGAGLDVTDPEPLPDGHPLWSSPNAIITPHSADTPEMTRPMLAERIRQNVRAYLQTGEFAGRVDPDAGY